ncbi:hypothetical protein RyT2_12180 [Pseudolactococcus yaeyamensis]
MKKVIIAIVGILILAIVGFGGKTYIHKKAEEKLYQDGVKQIQKYVTNYMVENYEGIEKIEWDGVGVDWGILVPLNKFNGRAYNAFSDVKVYASEKKYFRMDFNLNEEMRYDDELEKYVFEDWFLKNMDSDMDVIVNVGMYNASDTENHDIKEYGGIKKSKEGSPNAKIIYNLEVHEEKY